MNKTAIKNFAIWARTNLIDAVKQKAFEYQITEDGENDRNVEVIADRLLTDEEKEQRRELITQIKNKGYEQVMEEVAYTWFNRFIALRFMEVNGYLPTRIRLFTDENGDFKPDILKEALTVEFENINREKVLELIEKQDNEGLYKYLLITQCNALNKPLPQMFEKISNYTELLFPNNLLKPDSILARMVNDIPEEDWRDQVQIIGWMYQYYNAELKDDTFAKLKKNIKITKERIPSATQLFTPDWIVRYMIENSLGRLWYEGHNDFDKSDWKYYLDEAEQEPEVQAQLNEIRAEYKNIKPEDIKIIDPCMGSGHVLVYAFDVLMQIYTSVGWSERDASVSILENNIYGLDIDDRASQMAYFAVMMKARQYNRKILKTQDDDQIQPNIFSIQESNDINTEYIELFEDLKPVAQKVLDVFKDAKIYGSILNINIELEDLNNLYNKYKQIADTEYDNMFDSIKQAGLRTVFLPLLKQAILLAQKYDVVCTNPPYMGASGMDAKLSKYVKDNYPDSKSDLFAVFIERCREILKINGYQAMITQHAWMFLSSFEKLRIKLLHNDFVNMAHLGARAFEEIGGEVVQTTSFVLQNSIVNSRKSVYCRLVEPTTQQGKEDMFLQGNNRYCSAQNNFYKIPGLPIAYWKSKQFFSAFKSTLLNDVYDSIKGMFTGNNDYFLKLWFEISNSKIGTDFLSYNKGGGYRRWYGMNDVVIRWHDNGKEIKNSKGSGNINEAYFFKTCLSWNLVSTAPFCCRVVEKRNVIGDAGPICLVSENDENYYYTLAYMNSIVCNNFMSVLNPTINYPSGIVAKLPFIINEAHKLYINNISKKCVVLSKKDWNSFETSWDFKKHPLV